MNRYRLLGIAAIVLIVRLSVTGCTIPTSTVLPDVAHEVRDGYLWVNGVNTGVQAPAASLMIVNDAGVPITRIDMSTDRQYTLHAKNQDGTELANVLWDSDNPEAVSVHRTAPRFAVATGPSVVIRAADSGAVGRTAVITATSLEGGSTVTEASVTVTVYADGRDRENFVYYRDFGAAGDGETCDLQAIYDAHAEANRLDKPVRADYGATYYISGKALTAIIQTDTDWRDAQFIIDDRNVSDPKAWVFHVKSRHAAQSLGGTVTSLAKGQASLGRTFEHPSLVMVENNTVRRFIRRGANQDSGQPQREVFLVDVNGDVNSVTPILWGYGRITSSSIRPIDAEQLTITGGKFTTIQNRGYPVTYHNRSILIERSNTVLDGFSHYVVDDHSASPYSGLTIQNAANVTIQNSYFTGRNISIQGTYGISATLTANLVLRNVRQTNDITDTTYWGIFRSNESKNITFDGVHLSRFDAHRGIHNATVKNSTIGHAGIQVVGSGLLTVENTTVIGRNSLINLRDDYGSTWEGEITIRNSVFHPNSTTAIIINGYNDGTWDFGYQTFLPRKVTIDGLKVIDTTLVLNDSALRIFAHFTQATNAQFPMILTEEMSIRNLTRDSGRKFIVSSNNWFNSVHADF